VRKFQEFIVVLAASGGIGACVGLPFVIMGGYPLLPGLAMSTLTGIAIGISATMAFMFVYKNIHRNAVISFLAVFVIIGAGTFLGPLLAGYRNYCYIGIMILLAEIAGMAVTLVIFRHTKVLNKSLLETQKKFRRGG
jgi:hypothetical protein